MMGVVIEPTTETTPIVGTQSMSDIPAPSAPLYPTLPQEAKSTPPAYTHTPPTNPYNPFLSPAVVQAPVFVVQGGHLEGNMALSVGQGVLHCVEVRANSEPQGREEPHPASGTQPRPSPTRGGSNPESLVMMTQNQPSDLYRKGEASGLRQAAAPNQPKPRLSEWFVERERGSTQSMTEGGAGDNELWGSIGSGSLRSSRGVSIGNPPSEDDEGEQRKEEKTYEAEWDACQGQASHNTTIIEEAEKGKTWALKGVMVGEVVDLHEPIRKSARLRERGLNSQMPLRPTADQQHEEYQPWKMTDLTALMDQMPSLHGGASAWLLQLQTLTSGFRLALADMKALLARATDHTTMTVLTREAGLEKSGGVTPPEVYRTVLWEVLRRAYPTERNHATLTSFTIGPGEQPAAYLDRAKTTWRTVHDEPYDHSDTTCSMWKEMVVSGTPTASNNTPNDRNGASAILSSTNSTISATGGTIPDSMGTAKATRHHGKPYTDHPSSQALLSTIDESIWTHTPFDVGQLQVEPVTITLLNPDQIPIYRTQYRLKPEQTRGIKPTIDGLLGARVIYRTVSPWNTPILPVLKAGGETYRMVQDFRAVNDVTAPIDLPVPDPHITLSNLSPKHQYFTVVDLANAFFSIPLDEASQPLFAFTYEHQQYTYSVLPQGYRCSPGIFNHILKTHLTELKIPEGVILIQYVDNLLLGAPTSDLCLQMTKTLLDFLAVKGYKVKMSKVQSCRRTVLFLGREISGEGAGLSKSHRDSILHHPRPITVSGMLSFLGLTGYSRTHIPDYTSRTEPLREIVREAGPRNLHSSLTWTPEASTAFALLKTDLSVAAALTAPDYKNKFHLDVSEKEGFTSSILFQKQEGERRVLMYHSSKLDHIEAGQTTCSRYVAAVAKAIEKTAHLVMCHKLEIHTHHGVAAYLMSKEFTFSAERKNKIQNKCTQSHITFVNTDKNMADALNAEEGLAHSCEERAAQELKLRPDLGNEPLTNPDLWLYTDGCCYRGEEGNIAAYAVVQQLPDGSHVTLESDIIPQPASAQLAEIIGLTQALEKAEGKTVNIYTDSAYAHGAVHTDGPQWVRRNFTTTGNLPIKHKAQMERLIKAVSLPEQVAIMKCKGHQQLKNKVSEGNDAADKAAKKAGGYTPRQMVLQTQPARTELTDQHIKELQFTAGPYEHSVWGQWEPPKDLMNFGDAMTAGWWPQLISAPS
ncbi:unnamed protein product [Coregonus sp. 'balchen']|nr:unnamed protein product [Coregonus sp. 'balchen']